MAATCGPPPTGEKRDWVVLKKQENASIGTEKIYLEDIFNHMRVMEGETLPDAARIDTQRDIEWSMRPYLLDFLINVHTVFRLLPDTLFLAVNLLDRYCSKRVVYRRHYQLVGCVSMLIAAKYGDNKGRVPTIRELQKVCRDLYDENMFRQMELHILQSLGWVVGHPTVENFLQMVLQVVNYDTEVESMARFLSEIALFHKKFVSTRPSVMAQSSLALAHYILRGATLSNSHWDGMDILFKLSPSKTLKEKYPFESAKLGDFQEELVGQLLDLISYPKNMRTHERAPLSPQETLQTTPPTPPTPLLTPTF